MRRRQSKPYRLAAAIEPLECRRLLSAGDLDATFGNGGKRIVDIPGSSNEIANAVAIDANGKIVLAGKMTVGSNSDFAIVRLNANGTIDTTFGGGDGIAEVDFTPNDEATDIAIDSSGRIVVVGTTSTGPGSNARNFGVARLTASGVLDTTFSGTGKRTIDFGANDDATCVAISGSLIYVGGYKDLGTTGQFLVARLLNNGSLDTSYSGDGMVNFAFGANNNSRCFDMALQPDGKLVMVGFDDALSVPGHTRNLAVARLGTNAVLDTSFSGDGLVTVDVHLDDELRAVAIDLAGRIVAGGFVDGVVGGDDFAAIRLTSAGALDTSFNGDGIFTVDLGNADQVRGLALQPDGTITLSGNTLGSGFQAAVVQIQPTTGLLSTSFGDGGDGIQLVDFGTFDQGFAIAMTADYRTVIAGTDGSGRIAVGRLMDLLDLNYNSPTAAAYDTLIPLPDGKLLASSGAVVRRLRLDGTTDPAFTTIAAPFAIIDVAVDNAGRIVTAHHRQNAQNATEIVLRRYLASGAVDNAFSGDGEMSFSFGNTSRDSVVSAIAIDGSNRIVVAGLINRPVSEDDTAVARITSAGNLDPSFNGSGTNIFALAATNFDQAYDVAIQPSDGKIVVVGNDAFNAFAMRLNTDGSRDNSFAGNGVRHWGPGVLNVTIAMAVTFDASGRLVVGGYTSRSTPDDGFVARITTAGNLDTTFNGDGFLPLQFAGQAEQVVGVDIDTSGKIVTISRLTVGSDQLTLVRRVLANGSGGDSGFSGDGAWIAPAPGITPLRPMPAVFASGAIYIGAGERIRRLNVDPSIVDFEFQFQTGPQTLRVQFNDNVGASIEDNDVFIINTTTNALLPTSAYDVAGFDPVTNTAIVTFNSIIADGNYTMTLSTNGITNAQNMRLGGAVTRPFFFLRGDANRDRRVNLADFNILAANFGQSNRTFGQGDFNYDGIVNLADFNILAGRFGTVLAAAPGAAPGFGDGQRIGDDWGWEDEWLA